MEKAHQQNAGRVWKMPLAYIGDLKARRKEQNMRIREDDFRF